MTTTYDALIELAATLPIADAHLMIDNIYDLMLDDIADDDDTDIDDFATPAELAQYLADESIDIDTYRNF